MHVVLIVLSHLLNADEAISVAIHLIHRYAHMLMVAVHFRSIGVVTYGM
jgi:hypothetical protein